MEEAVEKFSEGVQSPTGSNKGLTPVSLDADPDLPDSGIYMSDMFPGEESEHGVDETRKSSFEDTLWISEPTPIDFPPSVPRLEACPPALHRAASKGNESIARLLLDRGADITMHDHLGQTALHVAARSGREGIFKVLLEKKIDPNIKDSLGRTALFHAVESGSLKVVKGLLDASVDVNLKDMYGTAALHLAVEQASEPLIDMLLTYGADINA